MKKQGSTKSVFMVVSETYGNEFRKTFKQAEDRAKEIFEIDDEGTEVYEVVASWAIYLPETPIPDTITVDLKGLVK